MSAACSAEDVAALSGHENDEDDSFADSAADLLSGSARRSQSFLADIYLVLSAVSDI